MDSDACCTDAATISYLRVNIFQKISYLLSVSNPRTINYSMHHLLSKYSRVLRLVTALRRMKYRVKCGWIHVQQCTSKYINGLPNENQLLKVWLIRIFVPRYLLLSTQGWISLMPDCNIKRFVEMFRARCSFQLREMYTSLLDHNRERDVRAEMARVRAGLLLFLAGVIVCPSGSTYEGSMLVKS